MWAAQVEAAQEGEFRLADLTSLQTLLTSNDRSTFVTTSPRPSSMPRSGGFRLPAKCGSPLE